MCPMGCCGMCQPVVLRPLSQPAVSPRQGWRLPVALCRGARRSPSAASGMGWGRGCAGMMSPPVCGTTEQCLVPSGSCVGCLPVQCLWVTSTAPADGPIAECWLCCPGHTARPPCHQHWVRRPLLPPLPGLFHTPLPVPGHRLRVPRQSSLLCPPQAIARSSLSRAWSAPSWR